MYEDDRPEPSERERAHVRKLHKLVSDALVDHKPREKQFQGWRRGYRGRYTDAAGNEAKYRTNMAYANIAAIMPQIYAKNPDISFAPREGVAPAKYELIKKFAKTGEVVVRQQLLDASLKRRAKVLARASMVTAVGWWKVTWQEVRKRDPISANRANDIQDNLDRIKTLSKQVMNDSGADREAEQKELEDQLKALQEAPEVTLAKGIVLDPILAEDVIILDKTIRSADEYVRANRIAHRIWMSCEEFYDLFGYKSAKARVYSKIGGDGGMPSAIKSNDSEMNLVFEIWDKSANTIYTLAEGEDRYVREPYVPKSIGERWYPFFALQFNPVDGEFYGMSDVELLEKLVEEYNRTRDDLAKHREENLPVRLGKKGGNLTDDDAARIQNRKSGDFIFVNGGPTTSLKEDIAQLEGIPIDINNYDTMPIRYDMESLIGGGDAARGSITKAKTATEAEIMALGLRSRTEERQDAIEDLLVEVSKYVFEVCLFEISADDAVKIAGPDAVWPTMSRDEAYGLVQIDIKAGTTGKPNKSQDQERWLELLPIVKEALVNITELRAAGQHDMADAVTELVRETFRRFDERIDVDKFIPPPAVNADIEAMAPEMVKAKLVQALQLIGQMQAQMQQIEAQCSDDDRKADKQHKRDKELTYLKAGLDPNKPPQLPAPGGAAPGPQQPQQAQQMPMDLGMEPGMEPGMAEMGAESPEPAPAPSPELAAIQEQMRIVLANMTRPKPPRRVVLASPSGGQYVGIVDGTSVEIQAPSGRTYTGAISEAP